MHEAADGERQLPSSRRWSGHGCGGVEPVAGRIGAEGGAARACGRFASPVAIGEPRVAPPTHFRLRRFRTRIAAASQERVVARVGRCSKRRNRSVGVKPKLVDIDLASFVPSSFWSDSEFRTSLRSYAVVAAANGLVCISNSGNPLLPRGVLTDRYCVLNPLTRTCKVLPPVPFQPDRWLELTPDAITIFGWVGHEVLAWGVLVATYDLQAASGNWDCAAYRAHDKFRGAGVAVCAGKTFLFYNRRLHVLAPGLPDESISMLVEVGELEQPSLELLGVDVSLYYGRDDECLEPLFTGLEAHRGEVFFFMRLDAKRDGEVDILMCVWRLAREWFQWEAVARLDVADLERLTALEGLNRDGACQVWAPCGLQESLWFCVEVGGSRFFWLDFNLDTGEWELAHDNKQRLLHGASSDESVQHEQETVHYWNYVSSMPFKLRSDLFL